MTTIMFEEKLCKILEKTNQNLENIFKELEKMNKTKESITIDNSEVPKYLDILPAEIPPMCKDNKIVIKGLAREVKTDA